MNLNYMKMAGAMAAGGLDEMLERNDAKATPVRTGNFKTYSDYGRVGSVVGGIGLQIAMPKYADIGEGLMLGGLSLLTKSVVKAVAPVTAAGMPRFAPARYAPARQVGQVTKPGFEDLRTH